MKDKMKNIKKTQEIVQQILEKVPQTRNSDMLLYYHVCLELNRASTKLPFWMVLLDLKSYGLPPIESVGRARRKLQGAFPELRADDCVKKQRTENEAVIKEYARSVGGF